MITPNYTKYFTDKFTNRWVCGVGPKANNSNIPSWNEQGITV